MKVSYSKVQLNDAINFIAKNNSFFKDKERKIKESILKYIKEIASSKKMNHISTMGFILVPDFVYESIDSEEDMCHIDIYVDPSLKRINETYSEDDIVEEIMDD